MIPWTIFCFHLGLGSISLLSPMAFKSSLSSSPKLSPPDGGTQLSVPLEQQFPVPDMGVIAHFGQRQLWKSMFITTASMTCSFCFCASDSILQFIKSCIKITPQNQVIQSSLCQWFPVFSNLHLCPNSKHQWCLYYFFPISWIKMSAWIKTKNLL